MKKTAYKLGSFIILSLLVMSCNSHIVRKYSGQQTLLSDKSTKASSVYLTTNEDHTPVISWIQYNEEDEPTMFYAKWNYTTDRFDKEGTIPIPKNASTHEEGMPKIAFKNDGTIMVVYESSTPSPGKKWGVTDLQFMQTIDHGKTWSTGRSVPSNRNLDASQSFSGICQLGNGEIGVAWLDTYKAPGTKSRPVKFAQSTRNGSFTKPITIESKGCECCRVAVSSDKNGNVAVAYRDLTEESVRDISIVNSNDNGKSFSQPQDFSGEQWKVDGCPHNGPSLAKWKNNTYATWFSGGGRKGAYFAKLDNQGKVLDRKLLNVNGRFSQVSTNSKGIPVIVYCEDVREGDSIYSKIVLAKYVNGNLFKKEISNPRAKAFYPVVRAIDEKNMLVAWKDQDRTFYRRVNLDEVK